MTLYDDVGNIHYGYVGSAIANPLSLLLSAAGAYQRISGMSSQMIFLFKCTIIKKTTKETV